MYVYIYIYTYVNAYVLTYVLFVLLCLLSLLLLLLLSLLLLPKQVKKGQRILVQDGTCVLEVQSWDENTITCKVLNDCKLGEKKNVNVPGVKVEIPVVGEREIFDIEKWGVPNDADYIALSFVQSPEDVYTHVYTCIHM